MIRKLLYILFISTMLFAVPTESNALFTKVHPREYYETNARECFRTNKWEEGKQYLDEGWEQFGSASVMNELMGRYYQHHKKYDRARYYLHRALQDDRSNNVAREMMVAVEEETKNYSSAICYINELLESNPYNTTLWRKKISIYRLQGNDTEADRLLTRLQQIYPEDETVKRDVTYANEQRLSKQRHEGNLDGQLETLQNLIRLSPDKADYYLQLSNALLQAGRQTEAIDIAERGARRTGNVTLMQRRASMLSNMGRYTEAINYLKDCIRSHPSSTLSKTLNDVEVSAAESAQMNDPYTSMAKVYSSQHRPEALKYLLNTSIARGYYDDALMYIKEAKSKNGETEDLLYKEFIVNRRLGNKSKALSCLTKIYKMNPRNSEVKEYLCEMRYHDASDQMGYGQYSEAIPLLEFVQMNTTDDELKKGAMLRLFNCFYETKRFDQAHDQMELVKRSFPYENYASQKAALYQLEGRTNTALKFLAAEFDKTEDPVQAQRLAYQYEEYAIPYVKEMMDKGMIRQADKVAMAAVLVCPTSNDLLHYAITCSDMLGKKADYEEMVLAGRARYPDDPFFIVKEADVMTRNKDYAGAVNLLYPELESFMGDEKMVNTFAEACRLLALDQAKARAYSSAIETIDTALVYRVKDRELLYTKGKIFEMMHQYDSAYVYQKYYQPTLMDYRQHTRHMEELKGQTYEREVTVSYTHGSASKDDPTTSNAAVAYTQHDDVNTFTGIVDYAGRDGLNGSSGGAAVKLGAAWEHLFPSSPWTLHLSAAWGSDYFPQITATASVSRQLKRQMQWSAGVTYRRINAHYDNMKQYGYRNMLSGIIALKKSFDMFEAQASADVSYIYNKVYVGGEIKAKFYPVEDSRTNIFASVGAGNNAPAQLLDNAQFCGFGKFNSHVEAGLYWFFNKHVGTTFSASWYTQRRAQSIVFCPSSSVAEGSVNMFFLTGQLHICF